MKKSEVEQLTQEIARLREEIEKLQHPVYVGYPSICLQSHYSCNRQHVDDWSTQMTSFDGVGITVTSAPISA